MQASPRNPSSRARLYSTPKRSYKLYATLLHLCLVSPVFPTFACLPRHPVVSCRCSASSLARFRSWKRVDVHRTWLVVPLHGSFPSCVSFRGSTRATNAVCFSLLFSLKTVTNGEDFRMPSRVLSVPPPFVSLGERSSSPFRKGRTEREDFPDRKRFSIHLFGIRGTNVPVVVDEAHRRTRRASSRSSRRHASCGGRSGAAEAAAVASAPLRRRRKKRGDEPRRHGRQNRQERQLSRADVRDHARRDVRNATMEENELTAKDGDGRT